MASGVQVAQLFARVTADVGDFERAMKSMKSDMSVAQKGMSGLQSAVGIGLKAAVGVGLAAVGGLATGIGLSVKAATDMEQGIANIAATMSLTAAETAQLDGLIKDLGLDPQLKVSAVEAAAAIDMLGKNGVTLDQIMGGAARSTVLLSNATGGDFAMAADLATDVMAQFGIKAADMDKAVNQIAGVTVASKFSVDDYRLAIAQAGGVASSVGVDFEDFNAAIAATSPSFASGSDAGTSFKTFLQRLVPSTDKAKQAMIDLGLSTGEDVVTAFFTADGAMRPMEEIAGNLQTAFSGLSEAQKIEAASTIFGTDAMRTALSLAAGGTPIIEEMKAAIGKVDAEEMGATRMNTFAGAMEIAMGVIETLGISIGQKFLPVLRPLVEKFTELAQTHGPKLIEFFGQLAERMATGIERTIEWATVALPPLWQKITEVWDILKKLTQGIMDALSPVVQAIGKFIDWKDVLAALGILIAGAVVSAIASFVAAIAPVVALVGGVVIAVAALGKAWDTNFLGIRDITERVLGNITAWFKSNFSVWQGSWSKTLDYFLNNGGAAWKQLWGDVVIYFTKIKNDIINSVVHWTDVVGDKIKFWIALRLQDIEKFVRETGIQWRDWKEDTIAWFQGVFSWFKPGEWMQKGRDIIQGLWDGLKGVWNNLTSWFSGVWGDLVDRFKNFFGIHSPSTLFAEFGTNMMEGLRGGIDGAKGAVLSTMDSISTGIESRAKTWNESLTTIAGLIDRSPAAVAAEQLKAKIDAAVNAAKRLPPDWYQPGATGMPPVKAAPTPTPMPQPNPGPVMSQLPEFFYQDFSNALWQVTKSSEGIGMIQNFAKNALSAMTAEGQPQLQGSSAAALAGKRLQSDSLGNSTVGAVLGGIQSLIAELRKRNLGGEFNISMAPNASENDRTELAMLVQYLSGLRA